LFPFLPTAVVEEADVRSIFTIPKIAFLLAVVLTVVGEPAAAQQPRTRTRETLPAVSQVDTSSVSPGRLAIRPRLTFVPIDTLHKNPATGQRPSMDEQVTLPNGRTMTRREFVQRANALEVQLNAVGYTIRGPSTNVILHQVPLNVVRLNAQRTAFLADRRGPPVRPTLLERQRRLDVVPVLASSPVSLRQLRAIDRSFASALDSFRVLPTFTLNAEAIPQLVLPIEKSFSRSYDVGDHDVIAAGFGYSAKLTGDTTKTSVQVGTEVDAWFFAKHGNLAEFDGIATAPKTGQSSAEVDITVLGNKVYTKTLTPPAVVLEFSVTKSVDYSVQTTVMVGPIPVTVRVGGRGSADLSFGLTAQNAAVTADFTPGASLAGYAEAGVTIWIAEAGAGAALTLLRLAVPIDGKMMLVQNLDENIWGIQRKLTVSYDVSALSGSIYVYAKVYRPCIPDFWNTCSSRWQQDLFRWDGVHSTGQWVSYNDYVDLLAGTVYTPKLMVVTYSPKPNVGSPSTVTFSAADAATAAALSGTVAVAGQTASTGQPVTATFCQRFTIPPPPIPWLHLLPNIVTKCTPAHVHVTGYEDRTIIPTP